MKVKVDKFCGLATSTEWQTWLFNHNKEYYKELINHLRTSSGCNGNSKKMVELLERIDEDPESSEKLQEFLSSKFPYIIDKSSSRLLPTKMLSVENLNAHGVFDHYDPSLLTYPKRIILKGENIDSVVENFVSDKVASNHVIIDDTAYIEYLTEFDEHLIDQIPDENWQTKIYENNPSVVKSKFII